MANQVADKQHHLAVHHQRKARSGQPYLRPETVPVNHGVEQSGEKYCQDLERLGELEPEKWHEDENGLVEEREDRELSAAEDCEERPGKLEESREVEGVGPEEDSPGGARAEGEAEEPLEGRGGLGAAPEPAGVADLCGGGEDGADEDYGGDQRHGEAMDGRYGSERDGTAAPEERQDEVERGGGSDVGCDGCEEEGPRGAPRLGGAPAEVHDCWVLW